MFALIHRCLYTPGATVASFPLYKYSSAGHVPFGPTLTQLPRSIKCALYVGSSSTEPQLLWVVVWVLLVSCGCGGEVVEGYAAVETERERGRCTQAVRV